MDLGPPPQPPRESDRRVSTEVSELVNRGQCLIFGSGRSLDRVYGYLFRLSRFFFCALPPSRCLLELIYNTFSLPYFVTTGYFYLTFDVYTKKRSSVEFFHFPLSIVTGII